MAGLLIACSSDDSDHPEPQATFTQAASSNETPEPQEQPQGLQFVLDQADGNYDIDELRKNASPEIQAMPDDEIHTAVNCFPSDVTAEILDQDLNESGNTATLVLHWKVTEDGPSATETNVDQEWKFERAGSDGYLITALPTECPFEASDPGGTQEPAIESPTPTN
jgi:hypothetical protein